MTGLLSVVVPEPIQFLNWGWWVIHAVGIVVVFMLGRACGKACAKTCAAEKP